jgi:hypothetical protein
MLGWAYLVQGEHDLAADKLRLALAIDSEVRNAGRLLQQLSS